MSVLNKKDEQYLDVMNQGKEQSKKDVPIKVSKTWRFNWDDALVSLIKKLFRRV